jgi:DNA-binding NarL/FixJ family response regulator
LKAARQKNPAALVVVMTGHASLTSALQATREGAYDYLRKPFNLQEIEVAVANAARLLHLREENGRLLAKLNELNAKLAELQQETDYPEADLPPAHDSGRTDPLRNLLWSYPLPWEMNPPQQNDLERLLSLYRDKLLTEREFQILKERILI